MRLASLGQRRAEKSLHVVEQVDFYALVADLCKITLHRVECLAIATRKFNISMSTGPRREKAEASNLPISRGGR